MSDQFKFRFIFLALLSVFLVTSFSQKVYAQDVKKNKIRLKVDYVKIMNDAIYFDIKAISRIEKQNVDISNIDITVYNEIDDEKIELGTITTNMHGKC